MHKDLIIHKGVHLILKFSLESLVDLGGLNSKTRELITTMFLPSLRDQKSLTSLEILLKLPFIHGSRTRSFCSGVSSSMPHSPYWASSFSS